MALCRVCACQRVGNESEDLVQMHTCTFLPTCGSNAHTNACKHPKCAHTQTFHCPQSTVGAARRGVAASRGQERKAAEAEAKAKRQTRPAHRMQRARKPRLRTHTPSHDPPMSTAAHTPSSARTPATSAACGTRHRRRRPSWLRSVESVLVKVTHQSHVVAVCWLVCRCRSCRSGAFFGAFRRILRVFLR